MLRFWQIAAEGGFMLACALAATTVFAMPAFAEDAQLATAAQPATQDDDASQTAEVTSQADLDNAAEGSIVKLKGTITTDLTVNKKLTIQAADGAVMKGTLNINADGVTISGVHFALDGTTGAKNSMSDNGKTGLTVKNCTFDITSGADKLNAQLNGAWLGYGANDATFDGNVFNIAMPGIDHSYVGINIVGASVKNTTVSNNQITFRKDAEPKASAHFLIANGNKSTSGEYGLSGFKVTANTISNQTGLAAGKSNTYGVGVSNAEDAAISGNTFTGLYMAVKPSMWPNEAPSKSIKLTGNAFSGCHIGIMMRTIDVQPGAVISSNNDFSTTETPYAGHKGSNALVWQSGDGTLYPAVSDAAQSGKVAFTLVSSIDTLSYADSVAKGQDVTFDLNGHAISGTLTNNGSLTIKDTTGLSGQKSSIRLDGSGTTTIEGGTYDNDEILKYLAKDHGVLVRSNNGDQLFTVLAKEDVLASAKGKVTTENGDLFFGTLDEAKDYAEKNNIDEGNVSQAVYTVDFDTQGNGDVASITVEAGKSIHLPAVPEVFGYMSGAWYIGDKKVESEFTPTSDMTLVAKWIRAVDKGNSNNNGSSTSTGSKKNVASGAVSKRVGKSLPQTGDTSAIVIAAAAATGIAAIGGGIVVENRRHQA